MALGIDHEPAAHHRRRAIAGARPTQHGAHARDDLLRREGLDDVVVGAELEPEDAVDLLASGREHHDRHRRRAGILAQPPAHVEPAELRQHQVEQDEVRGPGADLAEGVGPGFRAGDVVALALQVEGQ